MVGILVVVEEEPSSKRGHGDACARAGGVRKMPHCDKLFVSCNAGPKPAFSRGRAAFRCVSPIEGERPGP